MTCASRAMIFFAFGPGSGVMRFGSFISVAVPIIDCFTGSSKAAASIPGPEQRRARTSHLLARTQTQQEGRNYEVVYANQRGLSMKREARRVTRLELRSFTCVSSGLHHRANLRELLLARRVDRGCGPTRR